MFRTRAKRRKVAFALLFCLKLKYNNFNRYIIKGG